MKTRICPKLLSGRAITSAFRDSLSPKQIALFFCAVEIAMATQLTYSPTSLLFKRFAVHTCGLAVERASGMQYASFMTYLLAAGV
ncbi:hypothetical protein CEXT_542651 [Caerostris extrusa]|uniref:Uncharacterized protein n=1 Tax=Caerostris extrusa TaxID=172846 RepID=A0AAV4PS42_CAEEX|nr:hypothetical protein CEXT_542651 [Caerostris extrusa]